MKINKACWDCGSTIKGHHTPLCEFAQFGDKLDLPAIPGTQWWTEATFGGNKPTSRIVNGRTQLPGARAATDPRKVN